MKEYKLVFLNRGIQLTRCKDLTNAEQVINEMVESGWTLQEVVSPCDIGGALVGVFYKET